jgi:hypothetical protein
MARRPPRKPGRAATGVRRPQFQLGPENRKTYEIDKKGSPRDEPARCVDVDCLAYLNGWTTRVDESTQLGEAQAYYIRYQSGRRYSEDRDGELTVFRFRAGQRCFKEHRAPLYLVRGGDHRGNPRGERRVHTQPEHWVEDLHEHTDRVIEGL